MKSLRKLMMLMVTLVFLASSALAFTSGYMSGFVGKEVFVTVNIADTRTKTILIYVTGVTEETIYGDSNGGVVHIPLDKIAFITEQQPNFKGVFNHE